MPVRLIATDLDGTFFGPDHRPEPRSVAALNAVQAAGIVCVAITGRGHLGGIKRAGSTGAIFDWFIGSNGGHRVNLHSREIEEHLLFDDRDVAGVRARLATHDPRLAYGWETADRQLWEQPFLDLFPTTLGGAPRDTGHIVTDAPSGVGKMFVAHPDHEMTELVDYVQPHVGGDHNVTTSGVTFVEITPAGADKGSALARLCKRLDIVAEEVIAFGDNMNDLTMLDWVGRSIAMGNALDPVKEIADEVTSTNVEFGVARVLEELV